MRKIIAIVLILAPILSIAQIKEGKVIYEEKIHMEIDLKMEGMEEIASMLKDMNVNEKVLYFNEKASLYKQSEDAGGDKEISSGDENVQMMVVIEQPDEAVYQNFDENQIVEQKELMGKRFLIEHEIDPTSWKITGEQKKVANYPCQKAILADTGSTVVAWFTPMIPISSGPNAYGQLPGLILELEMDSGKYVISAKEVIEEKLNDDVIVAPKKGKKISPEKYAILSEKKYKEMMEMMGTKHDGENTIIMEIKQ